MLNNNYWNVLFSSTSLGPQSPKGETWLRPHCLYTVETFQIWAYFSTCYIYIRNKQYKPNQTLPGWKPPCGFPSPLRKSQSPSNFQAVRVLQGPLPHHPISYPFLSHICYSLLTLFHPHCSAIFEIWQSRPGLGTFELEDFLPGRVSPDTLLVFSPPLPT